MSQKNAYFLNNDYHQQTIMCTFFYNTKSKKNCETFLYTTKSQTLYKNKDNFCYGLYKMPEISHENFEIQKARHFAKSKTISVTFYIQNSGHFMLHDFSWNSWNWRRGGTFLHVKNNTRFYEQRTWQFALHFYTQKTMYFSLCFNI